MEDRMTTAEIGGKKYKLLFSLAAAKEVCKKYGSLDKIGDNLMQGANEAAIESLSWILSLLIEQGRRALELEGDTSQPKLTAEKIESLLTLGDIPALIPTVRECITRGTKRNIHTEDETGTDDGDEKN